jgi:prefoldin beta subunit
MADVQAKLQSLSEQFTKLQQGAAFLAIYILFGVLLTRYTDLQDAVQSRQKLEAQKQENLGVQKVCFVLLNSRDVG